MQYHLNWAKIVELNISIEPEDLVKSRLHPVFTWYPNGIHAQNLPWTIKPSRFCPVFVIDVRWQSYWIALCIALDFYPQEYARVQCFNLNRQVCYNVWAGILVAIFSSVGLTYFHRKTVTVTALFHEFRSIFSKLCFEHLYITVLFFSQKVSTLSINQTKTKYVSSKSSAKKIKMFIWPYNKIYTQFPVSQNVAIYCHDF